jgi:hypothetical protein
MYATLPNYRNYWRAVGHAEQVDEFERVLASSPREQLGEALTAVMRDEWLDDCTISGPASHVRERMAAWWSTGVMPVAVMSAVDGGQAKGVANLRLDVRASGSRRVRPGGRQPGRVSGRSRGRSASSARTRATVLAHDE